MMTNRIIEGAKEAVEIAKGNRPAASIHVQGHSYVPEQRWLPIESAPKDGTKILAFAESGSLKFYSVAEWAVDGTGKIQPHTEAWFWSYAVRPSHWMPLPAPPTDGETG